MPPTLNSSIGVPAKPKAARSQLLKSPLFGPSSRIQPMPFTITGADSERNAPTKAAWRNATLVRATSQAIEAPRKIARTDVPTANEMVVPHRSNPLIAMTRA